MPNQFLTDYQCEKVYKWESSSIPIGREFQSEEACLDYLLYLSSKYQVKMPVTYCDWDDAGDCYFDGNTSIIYLKPWGFNQRIIIHEFAHYLLRNSGSAYIHGRVFVSVVANIYVSELGVARNRIMRELTDLYEVEFSSQILHKGLEGIRHVIAI